MVGGKSRPKKDRGVKISGGMMVKTGQILVRGSPIYKAGVNVRGLTTLYACSSGRVYFSKKKIGNKVRTFINVSPSKKEIHKLS